MITYCATDDVPLSYLFHFMDSCIYLCTTKSSLGVLIPVISSKVRNPFQPAACGAYCEQSRLFRNSESRSRFRPATPDPARLQLSQPVHAKHACNAVAEHMDITLIIDYSICIACSRGRLSLSSPVRRR